MLKSKFDIEKNHQATYSQLAVIIATKNIPQRKRKLRLLIERKKALVFR